MPPQKNPSAGLFTQTRFFFFSTGNYKLKKPNQWLYSQFTNCVNLRKWFLIHFTRRYQLMILNKLALRYYAPELMNFQLAIVGDRFSQIFNSTLRLGANLNSLSAYSERVQTFSNTTKRDGTKVRWVSWDWRKFTCDLACWSFSFNIYLRFCTELAGDLMTARWIDPVYDLK